MNEGPPVINGAHVIIYSRNAEDDRVLLRDFLKLPSVDAGDGWLIFGLPQSELAIHPAEGNDRHELYLMCAEVDAFVAAAKAHGIAADPVEDRGWGLLTHIGLPGGGRLGVYQPRHARPPRAKAGSRALRATGKPKRALRKKRAAPRRRSR